MQEYHIAKTKMKLLWAMTHTVHLIILTMAKWHCYWMTNSALLFTFPILYPRINFELLHRLLDDTFTIEEVEEILKDIDSMVETEVETELFGAARTNVLLLQQIFLQVNNFFRLAMFSLLFLGSFPNYVDKILAFLDHLPPSIDIFYYMNVDKKSTFLDYLPPSSCNPSLRTTPYSILERLTTNCIF